MKRVIFASVLLAPALCFAQSAPEAIPAGTILPVELSTTVSSAKSHAGDKITARIMQEVPLADGSKIRLRTRVIGHVVEAVAASSGAPGKISIQFDTLEIGKRTLAIRTNLRAIASMMDVDEAQEPKYTPDYGTPEAAYTLEQIGGETVYRGGGHVMHGNEVVGEPLQSGGVLVTVSARPGTPCRGEVAGNTTRQAMWVFSSDACGVYDMPNVQILHAGRTEPVGTIVLGGKRGEIRVSGGTGMLLRVDGRS